MADPQAAFRQGGLNPPVDADELLADTGIDEAEIAWRKEVLNFDDADVEALEGLRDVFDKKADEIADRFYANLTAYEETTAVFERSDKAVEQLKQTQSAYLRSLAGASTARSSFGTGHRSARSSTCSTCRCTTTSVSTASTTT